MFKKLIKDSIKQRNSENFNSGNFDLYFFDFNLSGALLALAALQSGLKVTIIMEKPLNWEFDPEIVTLYPLRLRKMFKSIGSINYFEKISALFPTQVYPQRILVVSEKRKFHSKTASIIDFFLNRERDIASLPINFTKYPSFQILKNHFQNGLLVQEFRLDRNMAIIEILRKCKKAGACIVSDSSSLNNRLEGKCVFTCLSSQRKASELKIENFSLGFSNNIRIETSDFEITSIVRESNTHLYFLEKRKSKKTDFVNHVLTILKSLGIESPEKYKAEIRSIYNFLDYKNIEIQHIKDSDIQNIEKNCRKACKSISNALGKNIRLKKMIKSLKGNRFDGYSFRKLQTECDETFDLAKQTGIEYEPFCYFFYRYRLSIDDFIESAYQKMNTIRNDPQRIWAEVEKEYKDKIEIELFS
jgi:hypothetical protein